MSTIFKVNILRDGKIDEIHIFDSLYTKEILKSKNNYNQLLKFFKKEEIDYLESSQTAIVVHNLKIRYDDTIDIIKKK
jgi:hypothetical protein